MSLKAELGILPSRDSVAIILGFGCGIGFIILIAVMIDSFGLNYPTTPAHFLRIADKLPETKEFLNNYPNSNSTVFLRDIVEYWTQEGDRFAGLRIQIDRSNGEPTFMQITCIVIGNERDYVEIHGSKLEGITAFLQNERCP